MGLVLVLVERAGGLVEREGGREEMNGWLLGLGCCVVGLDEGFLAGGEVWV